ncbi:DUF1646 family protein [Bhargavaea beijingensis]|uniref:DUF1646 domain-containing protein n=1 Tax=Bhargavaea beijingensis TaxID=426756 RepID=A0A1G6ZX47_9BACL|nr:DUF1646 family protein [Bhargavaea beijingensis]MCW1927209.1 DUF1646 domain-containing protein [Bhargavaea beijingensis]RSK35658.1 DUF1646 domain-containing protein [Bhargavaea beijingensis]SDE07238.1 Predicted cation transporter [Bhargavaea beijingensis]
MTTGLLIILLLVLILPFSVKPIERQLELFLLVMGIAAAIIGGMMNRELLGQAFSDPLPITFTVLVAGIVFRLFYRRLAGGIRWLRKVMPDRLLYALLVIGLGLVSSMITAIIAALVLVTVTGTLGLARRSEIRLVILACYSIGLGAALTPIGEPLSTITVQKLNAEFSFLFNLIGLDVLTAILLFGMLAAVWVDPPGKEAGGTPPPPEPVSSIFTRSFKVYLFIMALTMLGAGFEPLIREHLTDVEPGTLYWMNMLSAVLDNATLAAAEISPLMQFDSIRAILLGLLISGGMLIPGNIPNIIAAGKLRISSGEWAKFGVPVGLVALVVYYVIGIW